MSEKERFGLLGRKLGHSYSKTIHNRLGRYPYELYEVEPDKLQDFMNSGIKGFNVTIPYKKDIMKYLDVIDKSASLIGAVNTVVRFKDKFKGYNTDFDGMIYMLNRARITIKNKIVMILGTGGTGNTAKAVCTHLGAKQIIVVSRSGEVNYQNYKNFNNVQVIINTTPVGMYPNNYQSPIELDAFTELEGVADVIYNPSMTLLCYQAEKLGVNATNGLPMLVAQAKKAKDKFKGRKSQTDAVEKILKILRK